MAIIRQERRRGRLGGTGKRFGVTVSRDLRDQGHWRGMQAE